MKKIILVSALSAMGFTAFAQTEPVQKPEPQNKPAKIILLKKNANAGLPNAAPTESDHSPASAALKLPAPVIKARSQDLPGLGTMPGEASDTRIKSVRVGADRNEMVYISLSQLNKIATPFDSPQAIDSTGATLKAVGQDLFLQPSSDKPLTIYITNGGVGQSIGITLVPKANLPAQSIVLQPDTPTGSPAVKAEAEEIVSGDYVSRITGLVTSLALGKTPAGFTRSRLPTSVVAAKELVIEPQIKYAGSNYDLYSYMIRSSSSTPLELKEEAFYTDAVRAVAFYPSAMLQENEETTVFVIADRPVTGGAQ